jgi:branched-chain amino acid transport system ATP-binding protein
VFPEISVWDNLRLGAVIRNDKKAFEGAIEEVFAVFPILKQRLRQSARDLSGGQQQMLALGQAFVARPKVLLSDEPSLGLAQALLPPILDFLKRWAASGTAIIIVEQHIDIALSVADSAAVVERGRIKLTCAASELGGRLQQMSQSP